jgi:uncharacterized membrane protein
VILPERAASLPAGRAVRLARGVGATYTAGRPHAAPIVETLERLILTVTPLDALALALFVGAWFGYSFYADREMESARGLRALMHRNRLEWARQMVVRDQRLLDASLTGHLMNSVSFYANTTIYIVAALIATAGAIDSLVQFAAEMPFAGRQSKLLVEAKIFLLITVFVFAYFKFTWAHRQYSLLLVLIGCTPDRSRPPDELEGYAQKCARLNTLAADEFNRGIRSYYFGFAALGWFLHVWLFAALTLLILAVLWRRDFRSRTARALAA